MPDQERSSGDFETIRARHVEEVGAYTIEAVARLSWTRGQVLEEQTQRLRKVIAHAQQDLFLPPAHPRRTAVI